MRKHLSLIVATTVFTASPMAHAAIIVDDGPSGSPNPVLAGSWQYRTEAQHSGTYNDTGLRFAAGGDDTATYTAVIPTAGLWAVDTYMTNTLNQANVPVSVSTAAGTQNLTINQNLDDATDGWMSLGVYNLNAGANTYTITSGGGNTTTDAVRWSQLGVDTPASFAVDSNNAGVNGFYSESGSWFNSSNKSNLYGNPDRISDEIGDIATTTAPLEQALYEIALSWEEDSGRADNALVRIVDAFGDTHDLRVNQTLAPVGDSEFAVDWFSLGTFAFDATSSLSLIVDDQAGGFVVSDGVRFSFVDTIGTDDPSDGAPAVPEPAGLALLSLAALTLSSRRRRH